MDAKHKPEGLDPPVGDPEAFERLQRWGGDSLVREIVTLFLTEAPARMARAWDGIRSGDSGDVIESAHALKSSCAQIGARRMQALCTQLEARAAETDLTAAARLLDRLEDDLGRFRAWLWNEGYGPGR